MGLIEIEGMEFYAYHGHFEEERIVGNKFLLDIAMETNTDEAEKMDNLKYALNYQIIYAIIKDEMSKKSYLLENIGKRILDKLFTEFDIQIISCKLKISKINPPMGGKIEKVSITLKR